MNNPLFLKYFLHDPSTCVSLALLLGCVHEGEEEFTHFLLLIWFMSKGMFTYRTGVQQILCYVCRPKC
jgi:hypothetical protein